MTPKPLLLIMIASAVLIAVVVRFSPSAPAPSSSSMDAMQEKAPRTEINPDLPPQSGAVLSHADGVTLTRMDVRYAAQNGTELNMGDVIEVSANGSAVIIWPHYGRTIVAGGSVVRVAKAFESVNRQRFEGKLVLDRGRIWNRFFDVFSQGQFFHVRAGDVLVEAPGGSFGVSRDENGEATIDVRWLAVRVARVVDESPTGDMRKAGFDEAVVEKPVGDVVTFSNGARRIPVDGPFTVAEPADDAFTESGMKAPTLEELDVMPLDVTLTPESSV